MIGSCWGSTQSAEPVASWWAVPAAADGSGAGRGSRKRRVGGISVENPSEGFPGGVFFTTRRPQAVKRRRSGMFEAVPRPGGPVMRSATMRVSALAVLLATGAAVLRRRRSMNRTASTARTPVARRDRIERSHVATFRCKKGRFGVLGGAPAGRATESYRGLRGFPGSAPQLAAACRFNPRPLPKPDPCSSDCPRSLPVQPIVRSPAARDTHCGSNHGGASKH